MSMENNYKGIAGFWQRIYAYGIDAVIIYVMVYFLNIIFVNDLQVSVLTENVIYFIIIMLYCGALNSKITHGQTPGKRLFKLRLVDKENQPISVRCGLARGFVYGLCVQPFYLDISDLNPFWSIFVNSFYYSINLLFCYLYLFNHVSRQSLHDMLMGTYVVNADSKQMFFYKTWHPNPLVIAMILIVPATFCIVSFAVQRTMQTSEDMMLQIMPQIQIQPIASPSVGRQT